MNEKNPSPNFEKNAESENGSSWDEMANSMPSFQEHMKGIRGRVDEAYAKLERRNVEKQKEKIKESNPGKYDDKIESAYSANDGYNNYAGYVPSTREKAKRLVLDKMHLTSSSDRMKQIYEAEAIAVREMNQENHENKVNHEIDEKLKTSEENVADDVQKILEQQKQEKMEHQKDFDALLEKMESYRKDKKEGLQNDRQHELSERAFNEALTSLDELEGASEVEGSGVKRRQIEYEGGELTVYDLEDYPFAFLQHAIDFKGHGEERLQYQVGALTAKRLQDNPALWDKLETEVSIGTGALAEQMGNTISMSYIDTNSRWMKTAGLGDCCYGFDSLTPGSLVSIYERDGGTGNVVNDYNLSINQTIDTPDKLGNNVSRSGYNEILTRRYDETGKPKRPDFMVVYNNNISELTKKHAAYFGVPIININKKAYREGELERLNDYLDEYDPNSSYLETKKILDKVSYSWVLDRRTEERDVGYGLLRDYETSADAYSRDFPVDLAEKIQSFKKLELEKRLEYIQQVIALEIDRVQQATQLGEMASQSDSLLKIYDKRDGEVSDDDKNLGIKDVYRGMNRIEIKLTMPDKSVLTTRIWDGEHPDSKNDSKNRPFASSSEYNKFLPLVETYEKAVAENLEL